MSIAAVRVSTPREVAPLARHTQYGISLQPPKNRINKSLRVTDIMRPK